MGKTDGHLTLLAAKGISKRFGGVHALSGVTFSIGHGEIYGLIGPNGAGKTSLFNVLTGIYGQDEGEFTFDGEPLTGLKPNDVAARGIARTFQNIRLFANLSALENVMIGRHVRTYANVFGAMFRNAKTRVEEKAIEKRAYELLEYVGVAKRANSLARHLAYGDQRRLEIARALATEPKLLALDEPAAGMNATETASLKGLLENIRRLRSRARARLRQEDRRGHRGASPERSAGHRRVPGRRGSAESQGSVKRWLAARPRCSS